MDYPGWLKTNPNPVNVLSSDSTTGWLYMYMCLRGREGRREGEREGGGEGERESGRGAR